eukprot:5501797-Lingulodinium_polyedra.AAC.1
MEGKRFCKGLLLASVCLRRGLSKVSTHLRARVQKDARLEAVVGRAAGPGSSASGRGHLRGAIRKANNSLGAH